MRYISLFLIAFSLYATTPTYKELEQNQVVGENGTLGNTNSQITLERTNIKKLDTFRDMALWSLYDIHKKSNQNIYQYKSASGVSASLDLISLNKKDLSSNSNNSNENNYIKGYLYGYCKFNQDVTLALTEDLTKVSCNLDSKIDKLKDIKQFDLIISLHPMNNPNMLIARGKQIFYKTKKYSNKINHLNIESSYILNLSGGKNIATFIDNKLFEKELAKSGKNLSKNALKLTDKYLEDLRESKKTEEVHYVNANSNDATPLAINIQQTQEPSKQDYIDQFVAKGIGEVLDFGFNYFEKKVKEIFKVSKNTFVEVHIFVDNSPKSKIQKK